MKASRRNLIEIALHLVWTTYERRPLVTEVLERSVYRCIEFEATKLGCTVLAIGGMPDHVHVVLTIPSTTSLANLMKQLKGASSALAGELLTEGFFKWADGYAAFSLSRDHCENAIAYVHYQKEHHSGNNPWPRWERTPE
ncbi:IS200/IS605 family transposase [Armatimonas sp.]|uniref:IS200/IS605 family transposase n=1 Tax=Armatimonas sp. TaxID=1872638 RepID=UPI00374DFA0E